MMDKMARILGPGPWPITGSKCRYCNGELAWRNGVGRLVITHAHGEDRCTVTCASMVDSDRVLAQAVLDDLDRRLAGSDTPADQPEPLPPAAATLADIGRRMQRGMARRADQGEKP